MEPVTTTSSTAVSPVVLVAGGIVIGATAATVVIKYQKEIKAAGVSIADKAKSLFGKKTPQVVAEVTAPVVEPTPAAEPTVIHGVFASGPEFIIKLEPMVVAEAPVVVAEAPITTEQVESVAKLAELLSPSITAEVAEPVTGDDMTAKVLSASITEDNKVSDVVLLTQEVAAGIAEAMTQLPQQQRVQQPYRHNKSHHQRR